MLWRRSAPTFTAPPVAPVPDAEALRRAALQASWQRGRWVARRRVVLRWALWAASRYLMPALAVFGVAGWLWLGVLPSLHTPWLQLPPWAGTSQAPTAPPSPAPTSTTPSPEATATSAEPEQSAPPAVEYSPEGEELPRPLALKFEARWAAAPQTSPAGAASQPSVDREPEISPPLKPENWLHSKEP